jgi:hypothetical protein
MKNWFTQGVGLCALALLSLTSACKKDETRAVLLPSGASTLAASTTTPDLSLTTANVNKTAVTFNYTAANYGYQAAVSYTLQFDKKGGTFANPVTYDGGTAAGAISLTTAQLVSVFTTLGYAYNSTSQVDARVVASVGAAAAPQVSAVTTITGTPTPLCIANTYGSWGIVGPAADGWPGATNTDRVMTYDCYTQTFSLKTTLAAGDLKFRADKAWTTDLGGAGTDFSSGVTLTKGGPNLTITTPGTYTVTLAITTNASGAITGGKATIK